MNMNTITLPQSVRLLQILEQSGLSADKCEHLLSSGAFETFLRKRQNRDCSLPSIAMRIDVRPSITTLIRNGHYDHVDKVFQFVSENPEVKQRQIRVSLVCFGKYVSLSQARELMRGKNLQPANLRILLGFGLLYPEIQRGIRVVSPTPFLTTNGHRVACLKGDSANRLLASYPTIGEWNPDTRFLGFRP
jgi:hypothetical protein